MGFNAFDDETATKLDAPFQHSYSNIQIPFRFPFLVLFLLVLFLSYCKDLLVFVIACLLYALWSATRRFRRVNTVCFAGDLRHDVDFAALVLYQCCEMLAFYICLFTEAPDIINEAQLSSIKVSNALITENRAENRP